MPGKGQKPQQTPSGSSRRSRVDTWAPRTSGSNQRTSSPRQTRHSPPPALGRMESSELGHKNSLPERSRTKSAMPNLSKKSTHDFVKRSKSTTLTESIKTTPADTPELPPHPEFFPDPRELPVMYKEMKEWAEMYSTHNCDDDVLVDPHNLEGPLGQIWTNTVKLAGFLTLFNLGKEALALCCPSGRVLVITKRESCSTFVIPDDLRIILEDKYIRKAIMHQRDVDDCIQPLLKFQMQGVSSLYKILQAYTTRGETSSGTTKYFRQQVDSKVEKPPTKAFRSDDETHLRFIIQGTRATAFAVWFLAFRVTERIGFNDFRNLTPYTRFVLGFSDDNPAMSFLEDPYYVTPDNFELLDTHNLDIQYLEKLDRVNRQVWKRCRPGYNEPFNPEAIQLSGCRMCGFHQTRMKNRNIAEHYCSMKKQCDYPYCPNPKFRHSVITCDALRGWCQNCQRRGHFKADHARPGFNRFYAGFVFRKYAYFGHETGFILSKPELARNPRHIKMTFYGLPSTLVPKVSFETGLVPTDPNFEASSQNIPQPQKRSRWPSVSHKDVIPTKRQKISPEMSLHRMKDGRIEKRTILGTGSTRPSMMASIKLSHPRIEDVKSQYDLQQLQSDLMTAQKISRRGTAASIGSEITDSVQMILNALEGERAYERSLIGSFLKGKNRKSSSFIGRAQCFTIASK